MPIVVGVRFKKAGKIYYFDPLQFEITRGSKVVVETARGLEYGEVSIPPRDTNDEEIVQPLKPVVRVGTERDAEVAAENKRREKDAYATALGRIKGHNLDMHLVDVEYTFDNAKIVFYFTAEGRIDFRELVKDLASIFRTRIEMRQIGVRDEAKLIGGIGPCGRILCCTSFLGDFAPVSIRMAKDQNLSLNPSKISGLCGRLMCCLRYEQDTYEAAKKDPTLAPGYAPPQLTEEVALAIDELDDDRSARRDSGRGARIAQAPEGLPRPARREGSRSDGPRLEAPRLEQPRRDRSEGDRREGREAGREPMRSSAPTGQQRPPRAPQQAGLPTGLRQLPVLGAPGAAATPGDAGSDPRRKRRRRRGGGGGGSAPGDQAVQGRPADASGRPPMRPVHLGAARETLPGAGAPQAADDDVRRRRRRRRRGGEGAGPPAGDD